MNNTFKYLAGAFIASLMAAACTPETFEGADEAGKPVVSSVEVKWDADYETNTVTASVSDLKGCYPVWEINWTDAKGEAQQIISTRTVLSQQFTSAGIYNFSFRLGNRNGVSDASIDKSFSFEKTLVDWSAILSKICGKEWRIDYSEKGHLGCGPAYSTGDGWWAAAPEDKKGTGVYDDRILFTVDPANPAGGIYDYNPGEDGLVYVNKGTTIWGTGADEDFDAEVSAQTTSFTLSTDFYTPDGSDEPQQVNYITLAENSLFPYISDDAQYREPKFRIESFNSRKMVLVYDGNGISWRFILTTEPEEKGFEGFDVNSDFNMLKGLDITYGFWYADENWAQRPDPDVVYGDKSATITFPLANAAQWQSQVNSPLNISTSSANHYDFSVLLSANQDLAGATVKLTEDTDDNLFYFADRVDLKAGETFCFWKSDMEGLDISNLKIVFDFGGCPDNFEVEIANLVFKNHADDDGTVLPDVDEIPKDVFDWDYNSEANLWKAVDAGEFSYTTWFADAGWAEFPVQPEVSREDDVYTIVMADATQAQWQGQFAILTDLPATMGDKYNFYCLVDSDQDIPQMTFKLTQDGDDGNYFFETRKDIEADVQYVFKAKEVVLPVADAPTLKLVLDFGGNPANTTARISKIYFEKIAE